MTRTLFLFSVLTLAACSSIKPGIKPALPVENIELDPTLIRAEVENGEIVGSEVIDSRTVNKEAIRAYKKRRYDLAIAKYAIIIEFFPDSHYYMAALYNTGLAYEQLGRWKDALPLYEDIAQKFPAKDAATDALYRMANCHGNLDQHDEVRKTTRRILARPGLTPYDKVEAYTRLGDALFGLGRLSAAEDAYQQALKTNTRAKPQDVVPEDSHFVVAAQYGVSRVYHELFRALKFRLPVERMERDLEDKISLFMRAQTAYIRTMRRGNAHWATAAGYNIGLMYEEMYRDLLTSETPELDNEESRIYFDELRGQIRPLMERALQIYEKNITLSERYGLDNDYTRKTQESLERLKRYISDEEIQAEDEKRIRSGENIETIGDAEPQQDDRATPAEDIH
jgi:tetratricopeptide (TPR) repeat protein